MEYSVIWKDGYRCVSVALDPYIHTYAMLVDSGQRFADPGCIMSVEVLVK